MKSSDVLILAAAAAAAWLIVSKAGGARAEGAATATNTAGIEGIFNPAGQGEAGYGWRYYDNGTAIDPAGNYYYNGQLVYRAR